MENSNFIALSSVFADDMYLKEKLHYLQDTQTRRIYQLTCDVFGDTSITEVWGYSGPYPMSRGHEEFTLVLRDNKDHVFYCIQSNAEGHLTITPLVSDLDSEIQ